MKKILLFSLILLISNNVSANEEDSVEDLLDIYSKSTTTYTEVEDTNIETTEVEAVEEILTETKKVEKIETIESSLLILRKINPDSSIEDIKYMQSLFKKIKLYTGKIDGNYESFKPSVVNFQIRSGAVGPDSIWLGYIGNLTFNKLNEKYPELKILKESEFLEKIEIKETVKVEEVKVNVEKIKVEEIKLFYNEKIDLIAINPNSSLEDIVLMQRLFKKLNLYYGKVDGNYSSFKGSIVNFQIKNNVIYGIESIGTGYIGNLTMKKLKEKFPEILQEQENKLSTIQKEVPERIEESNVLEDDNKFELRIITPESSIEDIKYMQEFFKKNKLYYGDIDGFYSSFKNSIIVFQMDYSVINSVESQGTGYVGPLTMKKLKEKFPEFIK